MFYLGPVLFAALIIVCDQIVKYLTVSHIALGAQVPALPGIFHFTYVQNTGASFSMLSGSRWLFVAVLVIFFIALVVLIRKKVITKKIEHWLLFAILGGGVANGIDRVIHGYVIDMFELEFIQFAVFNVADIFITCGCIGLFIYLLFFTKDKKEQTNTSEAPHDSAS